MNILYLTNHLNVGGITSYVFALAKGFKKRGHQIYIASSGGDLLPKFIQEGITYIPIPIRTKSELSPKILISLFKLSGLIKKNKIEIIHSNSRTTQVLGSLLSRFTSALHIYTCHGFFKNWLSRLLFPGWGDKVIAISEAVKGHLMNYFGVREEAIKVIHHGIDIDRFKIPACSADRQNAKLKIEIKKKFSLGDGPVVGIVARLSDVKGHIYLIEAMRSVLEEVPDAQLLIVGEGKMKKELVSLCSRMEITKNIFFIPSVYDTSEILSIMDLFVLPSLAEGLGLSLMEAMATGLAVIGSDVGGIRNLIRNEYNGLLVKPQDTQGLSDAILGLLLDFKKRRFLADNAQIFIQQNFSQEKMVLETEKIYLECLT